MPYIDKLTPDQYPGLPKWPGAFVTGRPVTSEQAKEILFRTDTSVSGPSDYMGGNDRNFQSKCIERFGWKPYIECQDKWFSLHKLPPAEKEAAIERLLPAKYGYDNPWDVRSAWQVEMGMIETEYVNNSFLSTAYIGGPHGWCSPDGKIHSDGHNYGKWPSVEAIVQDWTRLHEAFPYLHIACTLFSHEACEDERQPVCTILITGGMVNAYPPTLELHDSNPAGTSMDLNMGNILSVMRGDYSYERGWPPGWIDEFGDKSTAAMKKVAPWLF